MAPPSVAPTGEFWNKGNADEFNRWTQPAQEVARFRQQLRRPLINFIAADEGFDGYDDSAVGRSERARNLKSLMADAIADNPDAKPGNARSSYELFRDYDNDDLKYPESIGKIGEFYRLAGKTLVRRMNALQHSFTDEQEILQRTFNKKMMILQAPETLTISNVVDTITTYIDLLNALIGPAIPYEKWRDMQGRLAEIARLFGEAVPGIRSVERWQALEIELEARAREGLTLVMQREQALRKTEFEEQEHDEYWQSLPDNKYTGLEVGGAGECFFLSIAFMMPERRQRVLSTQGMAKWQQAQEIRNEIVTWMDDRANPKREQWREKVLSTLDTQDTMAFFVEHDCNKILGMDGVEGKGFDENMRDACEYREDRILGGRPHAYLCSRDAYEWETPTERDDRLARIYRVWQGVMRLSKAGIINQFFANWENPKVKGPLLARDGIIPAIMESDVNYRANEIIKWVTSKGGRTEHVGVPFAESVVIKAAAWCYKRRLNVYIRRTQGGDYERIGYHGRLTWHPWNGILWCDRVTDTGVALPTPVPDGRHYQPIIVKPAAADTATLPTEAKPVYERQPAEPRDAPPMPILVDENVVRDAEAKERAARVETAERERIERRNAELAFLAEQRAEQERRQAEADRQAELERQRQLDAERRLRERDERDSERARQATARRQAVFEEAKRAELQRKQEELRRAAAAGQLTNLLTAWDTNALDKMQRLRQDADRRKREQQRAEEERARQRALVQQQPPPLDLSTLPDPRTQPAPDDNDSRERAAAAAAKRQRRTPGAPKTQQQREVIRKRRLARANAPSICRDRPLDELERDDRIDYELCKTFYEMIDPNFDYDSEEDELPDASPAGA